MRTAWISGYEKREGIGIHVEHANGAFKGEQSSAVSIPEILAA